MLPNLIFRRADGPDLPAIIALLHDDSLGAGRETLDPDQIDRYDQAFREIAADKNQYLCVVVDNDQLIGTLQLTFIPGLSRGGAKRGQIEAVRVAREWRGRGIGHQMMAWAIDQCAAHGCEWVQLTSDKVRNDAHRFYERLGFQPSHVGYKLRLTAR